MSTILLFVEDANLSCYLPHLNLLQLSVKHTDTSTTLQAVYIQLWMSTLSRLTQFRRGVQSKVSVCSWLSSFPELYLCLLAYFKSKTRKGNKDTTALYTGVMVWCQILNHFSHCKQHKNCGTETEQLKD